MSDASSPRSFVLASNNAHKLREFTALLAPHGIAARAAPAGYACAETGDTFAENALQKARAVQVALAEAGEPPAWILADDSGLEVDALDGAPGVRSARYAAPVGPGGDQDAANRHALLQALRDVAPERRAARFVCVLAAVPPQGTVAPLEVRGELAGHIAGEERGTQGFGYDACFVPHDARGHALGGTLGELGPAIKDSVSHRARALLALLGQLRAR